jgi:hypothetical protein
MAEIEFDAQEKAAILAEGRRLVAEPPPFNPRPYGCLTFVVAAMLLVLLPQLSKWFGWMLPQPFGKIVVGVLAVALVSGLVVGIFLGSGVYGRAASRASASLEWLANPPNVTDPDARRRHAVTLVLNAVVSDGPTTTGTLAIDEARIKLGKNLQYVVAVERVLAAENLSYVHFGEQ